MAVAATDWVGRFLCCIVALGVAADEVTIDQPPFVRARTGGTATLWCTYTFSGATGSQVGQFKWYKDSLAGSEVSDRTGEYRGRISRSNQWTFNQERKADIQIHQVRANDSGLYLCEVELLTSGKGIGTGTRLLLNEEVLREEAYVAVGACVGMKLLFIIVLLPCLACKKKGCPRGRPEDAPPAQEQEAEELMDRMLHASLRPLEEGKIIHGPSEETHKDLYANMRLDD